MKENEALTRSQLTQIVVKLISTLEKQNEILAENAKVVSVMTNKIKELEYQVEVTQNDLNVLKLFILN